MFATLLGALPDPPPGEEPLAALVLAQVEAGLEPLTDGRPAWRPGDAVSATDRWRQVAALSPRAVKAVVAGPYSASRGVSASGAAPSRRVRDRLAAEAAEAAMSEIDALAAAGCPLVEVVEDAAHRIGEDAAERRLFTDAHRRLTDGVSGVHLSLSIVGGSAWEAGAAVILGAPYSSLAVDLIAGPDNWRLVTALPGDRGVVVGVLGAGPGMPEGMDILLYAAHYAASTSGRGLDRVGLGTAGSLATLSWPAALEKIRRLGEATRLATLPAADQADALDPRAVSIRAAATGRSGTGRSRAPDPRR